MTPRPLLLVIDDSPEVGLIVKIHGRHAGQEVICRGTAEAGWQYLQETRPNLLLLDLNLPGTSGWEMCRQMRQTPALADLPVALFSHWERSQDIAAGLEAGGDFVVCKDLLAQPEAWQVRIKEILTAADSRAALVSLCWKQIHALAPRRQAALINQALRSPVVRQLSPEVVRVVLRRAGQRAGNPVPLSADGLSLTESLAPEVAAEALTSLACSLTEQIWNLVGTTASAPFQAALTAVVPAVPANTPVSMKANATILLVEDNPADIHITQRALKETAVPVELVVLRDGQAAVDYLLHQGSYATAANWRLPDLILLDLNLPRLTGREVLAQIRKAAALRTVPVVILSTSHRQEDVQELYLAGANTYIEKPQDFRRYVEVLQTIYRYWLDMALLPAKP